MFCNLVSLSTSGYNMSKYRSIKSQHKQCNLFKRRKSIMNILRGAPHHLTDSPTHRLGMLTGLCACAVAASLPQTRSYFCHKDAV